jgi:hypothetical protein
MTRISELDHWIDETSGPGWIWYAKYLSANDTYAKPNVHQAGPYIAKELLAKIFPETHARVHSVENPEHWLNASIDSDGWMDDVRLVWYNSKTLKGQRNGRDEARLTNWGGAGTPLVGPNAPGSLAVFAFHAEEGKDADHLRIWLAGDELETERLLELFGDVAPGKPVIQSAIGLGASIAERGNCSLDEDQLPEGWAETFPSGEAIVAWVLRNRLKWMKLISDDRLLKRIDCEYELFRSIEAAHVLPEVRHGFGTVEEFVRFANAVTNRRKARAGRSLELQARAIFDEQRVSYSPTPTTEGARKPDFIFPSIDHYRNSAWPDDRLRMLAAKTTCKDRWRQILNEAARIRVKHLLTLQHGVSEQQHQEMVDEHVILVVPSGLMRKYPDSVRPKLVALEAFIAEAQGVA